MDYRYHLLPQSCEGCRLATNAACGKFTQVEGLGTLRVLVVAEASGEAEGVSGLPLRPQAQSGGVFEKALRRAGYKREQFYVTNILRCRPPGNWLEGAPWEREAIDSCRPNLDAAIERYKPRAILGLGGVPLKELTGLAGRKLSVSYLRGYVLHSRYGIPYIPTFHPSYIARGNAQLFGRLMSDIATAVGVAQGWHPGPVEDPRKLMTAWTSYDKLVELYEKARRDPSLLISYDIETLQGSAEEDEDGLFEYSRDTEDSEEDYGENPSDPVLQSEGEASEGGRSGRNSLDLTRASIRTVQFALNEREGVSVPWDGGYIEIIRAILQLPNPKVSHNGTWFDDPILERHGCRIMGRRDDTLPMYGVLQPDLPKHLQAVGQAYGWRWPWKHYSGIDIGFYGVADVCVLHTIMGRLPQELRSLGLWETYERRTRQYRIEVISPMEKVGLPVSRERVDDLREGLGQEVASIDAQIQSLAPPSLRKLSTYKVMPPMIKDFVLGRHPEFTQPVEKKYKNGKVKFVKNPTKVSDVYRMLTSVPMRETLDKVLEQWPQLQVVPGGLSGSHALAWEEPFNPQSTQQMQAYLKLKGYRVPISFKTGRATTSDKELTRLQRETGDPLIKLVQDRRVIDKMIGSYTGRAQEDGSVKGGWVPGPDGRLRATITFKSTGQLAASNPNTMTLPVRREELAERFRRCIQAEPGHMILELDMKAFHAQTTGLAAQDASYMRLSRLDIHSYVAAHMVKDRRAKDCLGWSDTDLLAYLTEIKAAHKRVRNLQAKPAILGIGFGMGHRRLYRESREYFASEKEAERLLGLIKSLFPKVFEWQDRVVQLADDQGYLANAFGRRRWFWDAKKWKVSRKTGQWEKVNGEDAEKIKAFLPSSNAHDMLREKCLELAERGFLRRYELVNIVHDALVFHPLVELVEEAAWEVKKILEAPVLVLADTLVAPGGFSCEAEASVGEDWSKGGMRSL